MWVLSTSRAELHEFPSPEAVPGGYAILSHVWDQEEQTFQITQSLNKICKQTGANPRDCSNPKIRAACRLAESHGYAWLWVDTSCIDKTSSADLSEAINSMYRYYSLARMCYAYLRDVPPGLGVSLLSQPGSAFYRSNWHTRGWTLQELIAPTFVLFLTKNWTNIATKAELADLLQNITHVPAALMRLDTRLADYSLAQRMSWAASRETSRPEDRAYSLLGIFGINMPTLYGEGGEEAFYRLQEEIMKRCADTTLFAWNSPVTLGWSPTVDKYLLAPSPDVFRDCGGVLFEPPKATAQVETWSTKGLVNSERSGTITFSVTPYGVLAHVPLIEHWYEDSDRDEVTAYLFWSDASGNPIGLRLEPCQTSVDPFRPHYNVVKGRLGHLIRDTQGRLLDFRSDGRQVIRPVWQEIYITHRPPSESVSADPERARGVFVPMNLGSSVPFRISGADVDALPTSPLPVQLTACTPVSLPWSGDPPAILQFKSRGSAEFYAMLHLGRCTLAPLPGTRTTSGHWAAVHITTKDLEAYLQDGENERAHDCDLDHIDRWPRRTKPFPVKRVGGETRTTLDAAALAEPDAWIDLRFDTCPVSPDTTLVTHISTRTTRGRSAPWALRPPTPPGAPWALYPPSPPGAPLTAWPPPPSGAPPALGPGSYSYIPATSGEQEEESAQAGGARMPTNSVEIVVPPRPSPTSTSESALSDSPLVSQTVIVPPPPVRHGDLASALEPGFGDRAATAEGSIRRPQGSGDDRLEREGDGGDANGRRNHSDEPVATTPAKPQQVGTDPERDAIRHELQRMNTETATQGRREGADGEEEGDSPATGAQGEDAVDVDDGPATWQGDAPDSAGVGEEGTGVSGDASAGGLAGPSRQVTPPPQTWGLFRFLDFKSWKKE